MQFTQYLFMVKLSFNSGELPTGTIISLLSYVLSIPFLKIVCKVVQKRYRSSVLLLELVCGKVNSVFPCACHCEYFVEVLRCQVNPRALC